LIFSGHNNGKIRQHIEKIIVENFPELESSRIPMDHKQDKKKFSNICIMTKDPKNKIKENTKSNQGGEWNYICKISPARKTADYLKIVMEEK
jgi:hypothetical protein